jgi:competence protein ComFC
LTTNWKSYLYKSLWFGLDLLFPPACGGCGKTGTRWCTDCQANVSNVMGPLCDVCGLPQAREGVCNKCVNTPPRYKFLRSWAVYDSPVRDALLKLKYRRNMALGDALSTQIAEFFGGLGWPVDVVVPIPLGRKRKKERGYNQVVMIAIPLAQKLGIPCLSKAMVRAKETRSQVGLSAEERLKNVDGAFQASPIVRGKAVLLVDDVATTGATLSSGAEALYSAGAMDVYAFTVARALPRHGMRLV